MKTLRPVVQTERGVPLIATPLHSLDGAVPHVRLDQTSAGLKLSLAGIRRYKGYENSIL
jgi:hypothetical protein